MVLVAGIGFTVDGNRAGHEAPGSSPRGAITLLDCATSTGTAATYPARNQVFQADEVFRFELPQIDRCNNYIHLNYRLPDIESMSRLNAILDRNILDHQDVKGRMLPWLSR